MSDVQAETGVYYRREDCLGVARRLLIDFVDLATMMLVSFFVVSRTANIQPRWIGPLCLLAVWLGYFVVLKATPLGTLGYLLGGAKVVDLRGERPSFGALAQRMFLGLAGGFTLIADIASMVADPGRRAIRDRVSGTYLVKKSAQPAGSGPIVVRTMTFMGVTVQAKEVTGAP
jgi:hypothetical protein